MYNNVNKKAYQNKQYYQEAKNLVPNYNSEYYIINKSKNKIKPISRQSIDSIDKDHHCQHKDRQHKQKHLCNKRSIRCASEYYNTKDPLTNRQVLRSNQVKKIKRVNSKITVYIDQQYQLNIRLKPTSRQEPHLHNQRSWNQSSRYTHNHRISKPDIKQNTSNQNDSLHKKLNKYSRSQSLNELSMKIINNNDIHTSTTDLHQHYNSNSLKNTVKNSYQSDNKNVISSYETANTEQKQKKHYQYEYKYTCLSEQALVEEVIYLRQLTYKLFIAKQKMSNKLKQYQQKYPHEISNINQ